MSGSASRALGVVGLDAAAVEDAQALARRRPRRRATRARMQRVRPPAACAGVAILAGADRPHRLVGEHDRAASGPPRSSPRPRSTWRVDDLGGAAGLALVERLADAHDRHEAGVERGARLLRAPSRRSRRRAGGARCGRRSRASSRLERASRAETSPVNAPSSSQCRFCAPSPIFVPASSVARPSASAVNGGQTTTSTRRAPSRAARAARGERAAASSSVLCIFQLPAIEAAVAGARGLTSASGRAAAADASARARRRRAASCPRGTRARRRRRSRRGSRGRPGRSSRRAAAECRRRRRP